MHFPSSFEPPFQLPDPDDLTDVERAKFSTEAKKRTILHLKAIREVLLDTGTQIGTNELTKFAADTYITIFRALVVMKAMKQLGAQSHIPVQTS